MATIFDFINSINNKNYILDEDNEHELNSFMLNRGFSFFPDTIFLANEANVLNLSGKNHYDFLYYTVDKKKRFSKWFKEEKNDDVDFIMEIFDITANKAKEYLSVLSDEDLQELKDIYMKGVKQ